MEKFEHVQQQISSLIKRGAILKTPSSNQFFLFKAALNKSNGRAVLELMYRNPEKAYSTLLGYKIDVFDYDPQTEKIYFAYSTEDYIQILPVVFNAIATLRQTLEKEYLTLSGGLIPQKARDEHWPIFENHCIQRVLLDRLFGAQWNNQLRQKNKAAYKQLNNEQLGKLLFLSHQLYFLGRELIVDWNRASLKYRGKA